MIRRFLAIEASGGIVLVVATAAALLWSNLAPASYADVWHHWHLREWVNELGMSAFFFAVGLEIKRELTSGELSDRRAAVTPVLGAVGGMVFPALVYLAIAGTVAPSGWAVPIATDIAFAVGVLTLAGDRVRPSVRTFLLALAIVDDVGAIIVIAVAFGHGVQLAWLTAAAGIVVATAFVMRTRAGRHVLLAALFAAAWWTARRAGVHPTLAAVAIAFVLPARGRVDPNRLEDRVHPLSSHLMVPIFALANAGLRLNGFTSALGSRVFWGVTLGLLVGKPVGIAVTTLLGSRSRAVARPDGGGVIDIAGVGLLGGIGFTVALFVAALAFPETLQNDAKSGIFAGSVASAVLGFLIFRFRPAVRPTARE